MHACTTSERAAPSKRTAVDPKHHLKTPFGPSGTTQLIDCGESTAEHGEKKIDSGTSQGIPHVSEQIRALDRQHALEGPEEAGKCLRDELLRLGVIPQPVAQLRPHTHMRQAGCKGCAGDVAESQSVVPDMLRATRTSGFSSVHESMSRCRSLRSSPS